MGDHLVYDFSQKRALELIGAPRHDANTPPVPPHAVRLDLSQSGQLAVDVRAALSTNAASGWLLEFSLPAISVDTKLADESADATLPQWEKELSSSQVLAEVSAAGRITRMAFHGLSSPEAKTAWKEILARWQVVLPERADSNVWTGVESDVTGTYVARYERAGSAYPQKATKRKVRYLSLSSQTPCGALNAASAVRGEAAIELNPYQVSIRGQETLRVGGPARLSVRTRVDFSFRLVSAGRTQVSAGAGQSLLADLRASTNLLSWAPEQVAGQAQVPEKTDGDIEEIMRRLKDCVESDKVHGGEHVGAAGEMIDAIREGSALALSAVVEALAGTRPDSEYAATLAGILGAAGTPEAQQALLDILVSDDWPESLRVLALQSFVQVTEPVADADTVLKALYAESPALSDSALMILAAMGERLRETDPARREEINRFILDSVSQVSVSYPGAATLALAAIANLGPSEIPAVVTAAWASDNAELREQAVQSLERIHTAASDRLLGQALSDADEAVRAAATRLLADPNRTGGEEALCRALAEDRSAAVRSAAVQSLAQRCGEGDETVLAALRAAAETDPSEAVRQTASEQLAFLLASQTAGDSDEADDPAIP